MLRAVAFQNFIYFRDHQSLEFQDGPNFIVGPNASGKTAIFELIRRCLSSNVNISTSRVADKNFPAFIICKFEIRQKLSDKIPDGSHVYSCFYIKNPKDESTKMCKIVCVMNKDDQQEKCYIECYSCGPPIEFTVPISTELSKDLDSLIKNGHSLQNLDDMIQKTIGSKLQPDINVKSNVSECETILQAIHDAVVLTFPIRSPGPIQWTHSENIGDGNDHYSTASNKAEILQTLLQSPDVNKEESDQIFKTIIHPLQYQFRKGIKDSPITVNDGVNDIPLLKVPVGIIEAKQFSLMFAHRKYQTLLLEEPDRGMHPPMIKKIRDLVIRRHKNRKLVLVLTSHQPAMINRWAMDRMFVCRRKRTNDGEFKHSVFRLKQKVENTYQEQDKLKQMLYSSCVLFVEGITDKTVVKSVFDQVLEAEHLDGFDEGYLPDLQKVVSGINVISIDGSTPYNVLKTMSEKLEIPCAFLFDSDTIFECLAKVQPKTGGKKWRNLTLICVRILLKRIRRESSVTSKDKTKEDETLEQVMNTLTADNQSVQKTLDLEERDVSAVNLTTVESFMRSVVLPKQFRLNAKAAEPYALPQNIQDSKDHKSIREYMKKNNVFLWDSGNLEDMICKSILESLESGDQAEGHHSSRSPSTGRQRKENLLRTIFLCEKYNEKAKNPKDPVKETLKQMDFTTAEKITKCLLNGTEMQTFLKFLQKIEGK